MMISRIAGLALALCAGAGACPAYAFDAKAAAGRIDRQLQQD